MHPINEHDLDRLLGVETAKSPVPEQVMRGTLHAARRRVAVRNVGVFAFGRLWLALARLLAPLAAIGHRTLARPSGSKK